ncbi:helix-turn-helix transcriptional regulator [Catenovulum sp. 2E275]|uniref:helix-turn-helix transcriptional regulator n=1 Tax=Catenovulum sp. 2E275 TaxID=2980497 RepID=UPI0021D22924|nr:helix-turn-helix transcriptional regulator [Catenovulum sp. 2E275]MCU4674563.1 helix-turn-helix transcriptional regulator [Catenovulum sp. 2E275]
MFNKMVFFSQQLQLLYSAPSHHEHFQPFLERLIDDFSLSDAILHIQSHQVDFVELETVWIAGPTTAAIIEGIEQNLLDFNYFGQFMAQQPTEKVYGFMLDHGRLPDDYQNYRFAPIHKWFDQHEFIDIAGCIIQLEQCTVYFHAHRQTKNGVFSRADIAALNQLVPHLKQAFKLYFQLKSAVYSEYDYSILDLIHHPSILFHQHGEVLYANESAKQLLSIYQNITLSSSRLQLSSTEATNQLKTAIMKASLAQPGTSERSIIHLDSEQYPLTLLVMPVQHHRGARLSGAIVYFYDKESSPAANCESIALIFGLTSVEVNICELLLLGIHRNQIALELERSPHTIKDYIKSIYLKTGVNSQSELVSLLLSFPY